MDLFEKKTIVYTAMSRHLFYARMLICKYVLENAAVPLNPFNVWGYFLYELVDRNLVRCGNNNIVRIADETWVFGPIADGVLAEIEYAMRLRKVLKFFSAGSKYSDINPITIEEIVFEPDVINNRNTESIKIGLSKYLNLISNRNNP